MSCSGPSARGVTRRSQAPQSTRARGPQRRANSLTSVDLPMPASPATSAMRPPWRSPAGGRRGGSAPRSVPTAPWLNRRSATGLRGDAGRARRRPAFASGLRPSLRRPRPPPPAGPPSRPGPRWTGRSRSGRSRRPAGRCARWRTSRPSSARAGSETSSRAGFRMVSSSSVRWWLIAVASSSTASSNAWRVGALELQHSQQRLVALGVLLLAVLGLVLGDRPLLAQRRIDVLLLRLGVRHMQRGQGLADGIAIGAAVPQLAQQRPRTGDGPPGSAPPRRRRWADPGQGVSMSWRSR